MYIEDLEQERTERLQKERDYYKWMTDNPNASKTEKLRARQIFKSCNTFNAPTTDKEQWDIDGAIAEMNWLLDAETDEIFNSRLDSILSQYEL